MSDRMYDVPASEEASADPPADVLAERLRLHANDSGAQAARPEQMPRVSSTWLGLREATDAAARAAELVALVRPHLAGASPNVRPPGHSAALRTELRARPMVIHDLGCGTGSMGRWLAPQLPGRQHWILYDRDADLLEHARAQMVDRAADGAPVTVETRQRDITRLTADDLDGAALVTASALLDLLTVEEIDRIAAACVGAGCPALLTLSVIGRVDLIPVDPLDAEIAAAFNAHQRRAVGSRRLLGPDAVDATVDPFTRRGAATVVRPSPWRLGVDTFGGADRRDTFGGADQRNIVGGADQRNHVGGADRPGDVGGADQHDDVDLMSEWFVGWLAAACEQRPELAGPAAAYADRRLAQVAEGQLGVVVHHHDLLARRE
jgi:SAM-dependent methyltransferase